MSRRTKTRRWVIAAAAVVVATIALAIGVRAAGDDPRPVEAASSSPAPTTVVPWSQSLPIPADATDEERLRIEMSYSLVVVPVDRVDAVRAVPGADAVGSASRDGVAYLAVANAAAHAVAAAVPEARVTANEIVDATSMQTPAPSWGLDAVDDPTGAQDGSYLYDSDGTGVTAYIVDTGIQSSHPDFEGRVDAAAGYAGVSDGQGTEDCNGHGTHVAGTVGSKTYGVAKNVRLVPVRVLGCDGKGTLIDILYGLLWIVNTQQGAQAVVNMSLGAPSNSYVDQFAEAAVDAGFVVVVAAGNSTADACTQSPAEAPEVITVGAVDHTLALAWYSNYGSCVDLLAPGSDITSTYIGSAAAILSGTSMASPHVAGLAARLLQGHPSWHTADVQAALTTSAATGHLSGLPAGTPNLFAAIAGVPAVATLTATPGASGLDLAWTDNGIGTFSRFALDVTDQSTGQVFPVVVAGATRATTFLDVVAGHTYSVGAVGTATLPSGKVLDTARVTASAG